MLNLVEEGIVWIVDEVDGEKTIKKFYHLTNPTMTKMPNNIIEFIVNEYKEEPAYYNSPDWLRPLLERHLSPYLSIPEEAEQEQPKVEIKKLKEVPTERTSMIEYLKLEKITWFIGRKYDKKEVKAYNDWIETSIQRIASCMTKLVEQEAKQPIEKVERQLCELTYNTQDQICTKYTHDTEWTINKLIEAVNYLLSKDV